MYRLCVVIFLGVANIIAVPDKLVVAHDKEKIIGGVNASIEEHPHMVALEYFERHRAGGSIIAQQWVLTAAHCVTNEYTGELLKMKHLRIRAGTVQLHNGGDLYEVEDLIIHENFNLIKNQSYDYDIALVLLTTPIQYTLVMQPIKLHQMGDYLKVGQRLNVTGWGWIKFGGPLGDTLKRAEVHYMTNEICNELIRSDVTERMLCAAREGGQNQNAFKGDSGGPLVTQGVLVGVVSWGDSKGIPLTPAVYASVAYFRDWIRDTIAGYIANILILKIIT